MKESKLAIYRSYILSNFNYCPLVWHFCRIQNSRNMEKIQERALRFVYEDYQSTYDILLKKGNHVMLYIGRLRIWPLKYLKHCMVLLQFI